MADAAATLTPEQKNLILGGESCQWAEWVTPENIDSHIWPQWDVWTLPPFLLAAELIEGGQGTKASAVTTTILPVELTLRQSCGCPLEIAKGQQ